MLMERVEMVYHEGADRIEAGKITPPKSRRRLVEQQFYSLYQDLFYHCSATSPGVGFSCLGLCFFFPSATEEKAINFKKKAIRRYIRISKALFLQGHSRTDWRAGRR